MGHFAMENVWIKEVTGGKGKLHNDELRNFVLFCQLLLRWSYQRENM